MVPVIKFFLKETNSEAESLPSSVGNVPVISFVLIDSIDSLVHSPSSEGRGPFNLLDENTSHSNSGSNPISVGIVPTS